jgi:hypothetical protein
MGAQRARAPSMRASSTGDSTSRAPVSHWSGVVAPSRRATHAATAPWSMRHRHSHGPMYWKSAGRRPESGRSSSPAQGMESVYPSVVPRGCTYPGMAPSGRPRGVLRKKNQPSRCWLKSSRMSQRMRVGSSAAGP